MPFEGNTTTSGPQHYSRAVVISNYSPYPVSYALDLAARWTTRKGTVPPRSAAGAPAVASLRDDPANPIVAYTVRVLAAGHEPIGGPLYQAECVILTVSAEGRISESPCPDQYAPGAAVGSVASNGAWDQRLIVTNGGSAPITASLMHPDGSSTATRIPVGITHRWASHRPSGVGDGGDTSMTAIPRIASFSVSTFHYTTESRPLGASECLAVIVGDSSVVRSPDQTALCGSS
jgi:hypothetical protein